MDIYPKDAEQTQRLQDRLDSWLENVVKWHENFVWSPNERIPFVHPVKPLAQAKLALVSTTGTHLRTDEPFDVKTLDGDWSFRTIPSNTPASELVISDTHYDHTEADQDIDCLFPITHLRAIQKEGIVGELAQEFYGFMGFIPDPARLKEETAPAVAKALSEAGVDVVLLTPGCAMCHHSIAIIQSILEEAGMATISISLKPEVTHFMNVPRAVHVRYPYGYTLGPAFDATTQREILAKTLDLLYQIEEPGTMVKLPYRWRGRRTGGK